MPECEAFPEEAGRFEREECEEDAGEATYVSYGTVDEDDVLIMSAYDIAFELGKHDDFGWTIDCQIRLDETDDWHECDFGSASYMTFDDDEIPHELKTLGQSVTDDIIDEIREDALARV